MKTRIFTLFAFAAASVALFSCAKIENFQIDVEKTEGTPYEISVVSPDPSTKTVNDGMSTTWKSGDAINLFHGTGSTYTSDGSFSATSSGASVTFSGTISGTLSADTYDWYAVYPYNSAFTTPGGSKTITIPAYQTQTGNTSKAHLVENVAPLAGKQAGVAKDDKPEIAMKNLTSVVKVALTNKSATPISVKEVSITAPDKISGAFNLDVTGANPVLSGTSGQNSSTLIVKEGESIASNNVTPAEFYIAIKPFTAAETKTITLNVVTNHGKQSVTSAALASDFEFQAGKMHKLTFNYTLDNPSNVSTEATPVIVGFETAEGFTNVGTYNNQYLVFEGTNPWAVYYGHASNTNAIAGSTSMQMRWYTSTPDNIPYTYSNFALTSVRYIDFKAKASENDSKKAGLKVYYSTNNRLTWILADTKTLTTDAADYQVDLGSVMSNVSVKFEVDVPDPAPASGNLQVYIDNVTFSKTITHVSVSTTAASDLASATGKTATLNGSLSLMNGGVIGSLEEAGFYFKKTADATFTKVVCDPTPTSAGAFSYGLSGTGDEELEAGTEYTVKAYAKYSGEDEVTGSTVTFTPIAAIQAVYTVTSKTAVSTTGTAPSGSSASFDNNDTNNNDQVTSGKRMILTLTGYKGKTIKNITLYMRSNASKGAGTFSAVAGTTTLASISSNTGFSSWYDNTSFGTTYRDVHVTMTNTTHVIGEFENVVITITGSTNSLYCSKFTIEYQQYLVYKSLSVMQQPLFETAALCSPSTNVL